jgi:SNF2 family DNA or RNA helicase
VDDVTDSSKAQRLIELVTEAESEGRKVIVFSFFLNTLKMVREALGDRCVNTINGSVPVAKRQQIIDAFDRARPGAVLPAQIQSGGTGLNIQSASVVIMCEPQLKPSIENQAISRAYRMGQARNVLVYRLLCENTIEERIMERLSAKQLIFDSFADTSVAAERSQEIDERTFGSLIQLEIDQINQQKLSQS